MLKETMSPAVIIATNPVLEKARRKKYVYSSYLKVVMDKFLSSENVNNGKMRDVEASALYTVKVVKARSGKRVVRIQIPEDLTETDKYTLLAKNQKRARHREKSHIMLDENDLLEKEVIENRANELLSKMRAL